MADNHIHRFLLFYSYYIILLYVLYFRLLLIGDKMSGSFTNTDKRPVKNYLFISTLMCRIMHGGYTIGYTLLCE